MTITLRDAAPGDLDAIRALHTASWRSAYAPFVPAEAIDRLEPEMAARWAVLPPDVICAVEGDRLVGFVRLMTRHGWPFIDNLHASPERRGTGIGHRLIRAAAERLDARGEGRVWLTVISANRTARRFYAAHGGIEAGPTTTSVLGHPTPIVAVIWNRLGPLLSKNDGSRPIALDGPGRRF
ncbi:GNAT family N-acetyltransferase [Palleronia sp. LCG004]|uniref:GNAT family N-acetyltransferase n=1 Tax=Palleronia sp. LCG004 TaxID=3079304 RepID=UPI002943F34A|nr:GNAT family N-acetyltransferase [Palleronia sp. LCG004]WOI55217.1 GNAT family N-acetyltransferase [Palleronia sp. LCG004]